MSGDQVPAAATGEAPLPPPGQHAAECPACRTALREGARYCVRCGLEVRPPCPACGSHPRLLPTLDPGLPPWCPGCGSLLNACETCGRPLGAGSLQCPDPQCCGRVLPLRPQHTGRRWDGSGAVAGWSWPEQWERYHPRHRPPRVESRPGGEEVHAALAAHGRLHLWEGTNLVTADSAAPLRTHLGPSGRPAAAVPFAERVAVAGAAAVLALERLFLLADLGGSGHTQPLPTGAPLAQVAGPGWWAGWSEEDGARVLRRGRVGDAWDALAPETVSTPAEAALAPGGRMALRGGAVYWPGQDGATWSLDLQEGAVTRAVGPVEGLRTVWATSRGPQTARESQGIITLGLGVPGAGRHPLLVPAGVGPLREVMELADHVVVVGDRVTAFRAATGERLHEGVRPPGRWVEGALAPAADGEPRLLALTLDGAHAALTCMRASSGAIESLWMAADVVPRALLPVGDSLFVVHSGGVAALL